MGDRSFKSVRVTERTTASQVCAMIASKVHLERYKDQFTLLVVHDNVETPLPGSDRPLLIKRKWMKDGGKYHFLFAFTNEASSKLSYRLSVRLKRKQARVSIFMPKSPETSQSSPTEVNIELSDRPDGHQEEKDANDDLDELLDRLEAVAALQSLKRKNMLERAQNNNLRVSIIQRSSSIGSEQAKNSTSDDTVTAGV